MPSSNHGSLEYGNPIPGFMNSPCARIGVEPEESVFLDDLGVNLKPARALGMHTIKVSDPDQALAELGSASSNTP